MAGRSIMHVFTQLKNLKEDNSSEQHTRFLLTNAENYCDFPAFCDESAANECLNFTLISCSKCDVTQASLFLFVVLSLSLLVLISNSLTLGVGIYRRKKASRRKIDDVRSSLAIADLLTGIQLMIVVSYNFHWVTTSTGTEVIMKITTSHGSASSVIPALFNLFTFTSSLYHLLYMGMQRLHAIAWPISYKFQSKSSVYRGLAAIWILAAIAASLPAWFPGKFTFSYYSSTMLYWPMLKGDSKIDALRTAVGLMFFFYIFPFFLMTVLTITSAILIQTKLNSSRRITQFQFTSDETRGRLQDRSAFKTVTIMQLGFTITIAPLIVVTILYYTAQLDCKSITIPYFVSFYLSIFNSLLNVIIYSVRDKTFRSSIREIFENLKSYSVMQKETLTTSSGK